MNKKTSKILSVAAIVLLLTASMFCFTAWAEQGETEYCSFTVEKTYADAFSVKDSTCDGRTLFAIRNYSGSYGNQLSGLAKDIYNSLVNKYATGKGSGNYVHNLATPFTFNAVISGGYIVVNDELEEIYGIIDCAVQSAIDAFFYDHPEVFWMYSIASSYSVSAYGNSSSGYTGKISSITLMPSEIYSGASAKISTYDSAVNSVVASINKSADRYDVLRSVHDYICKNAYYSYASGRTVHSSEAFFIGDGGVVCEGYAKAFKVICDKLNIPCALICGDADGAHMWNYVQMEDGKWYLVDVTWDDQDSGIYYTYFLANSNTQGFYEKVSNERSEDADFSGSGYMSFDYPLLSSTEYVRHTHSWSSSTVAATLFEDGSVKTVCACGAVKTSTAIYCPEVFSLSSTSYTYNKETKKPAVTVKDRKGNVLQNGTDYTVEYESGRTLPGKYTVTVTLKGKYSGTKKLYFTIKPRVTSEITATQTITTLTLKWKKVTGADKYRVYMYNNSAERYVLYKTTSSTSLKLTELLEGSVCKFKIKAFTEDDGTIYGSYSPVFETATKTKTPSITDVYSKTTGKAVIKWKNVSGESGFQLYRATSKDGTFTKVKSYSADKTAGSSTSLTSGKTYYFKVRAYIKTESGVVYSSWSSVKSVKIK